MSDDPAYGAAGAPKAEEPGRVSPDPLFRGPVPEHLPGEPVRGGKPPWVVALLLPLRAANAELHRLYVARKGAKSKAPVCDPADAAAAPSVEPPADLDAFPPAPDVIVPSDEGILLPTGT